MFERKDAVPALFLLLLIFAIIVTLSQILVVHQHNHRSLKPKRDSRKFNAVMMQLEITIDAMMKANILTQEKYERALMAQIYASRVRNMLVSLERHTVPNPVKNTPNGLKYIFKADDWKARVLQNTVRNHKMPHKRNSDTSNNQKLNHNSNINRNQKTKLIEKRNARRNQTTNHTENNNSSRNQKTNHIENNNTSRNQKTNNIENNNGSRNQKTNHIENNNTSRNQKTNNIENNNTSRNQKTNNTENNNTSRNQKTNNIENNNGSSNQRTSKIENNSTSRNQNTNHKENNDTSPSKQLAARTRRMMNGSVSAHSVGRLRLQTYAKEFNKISGRHASSQNDCVAKHRVAIVIPYRDRREHLDALLHHLIPILKRQRLDFRIFVVEQHGNETFNKGRLMNAGFIEAWKITDFNCFVFHDVDLIPENDQNMYTCPPDNPRHMSVAVDKFNYSKAAANLFTQDPNCLKLTKIFPADDIMVVTVLPYQRLVGGVFSIRREHFLKVNGYSNLYWGWGAEDDDMALRLKEVGLSISRPPTNVARYKMIKHNDREKIPFQWTYYLLRTLRKRFRKDGLNSLSYKLISVTEEDTYTHVMVDIGAPPKKPIIT